LRAAAIISVIASAAHDWCRKGCFSFIPWAPFFPLKIDQKK
jgi:hypothetical protein